MIDHKNGFGRGGELDVQIRGTKITIKEKKAQACEDVCKKSNQEFFDLDKR